ncbi:MAG: hypothetical protein ACTSQE_16010 [Candidatus Heimdallarchaeaceae archaeon]
MTDLTKNLRPGDRFRFEQITVETRKMSKPIKIQGSKGHRAVRVKFSKSGIVFVEKTWKYIAEE